MKSRLSLLLLFIALPTLSLSAQTQPQPTTLRSLLLHELRTTHTKAEWFVPINTAVEGLTAEQANWRPPNGGHSAGQLAYHLLFWNRRNLSNLQGVKKNDKFNGDNKETFDKFDNKQWADIVNQLDQVMTDLEKLVETADDQPNRSDTSVADPAAVNLQVLPASTLQLDNPAHFVRMPRLDLFAAAGYPFTSKADGGETAVVLPAYPCRGFLATGNHPG